MRRGELHNLGHDVARNTVKLILLDHGIEPGPERGRDTVLDRDPLYTRAFRAMLKTAGVKDAA